MLWTAPQDQPPGAKHDRKERATDFGRKDDFVVGEKSRTLSDIFRKIWEKPYVKSFERADVLLKQC